MTAVPANLPPALPPKRRRWFTLLLVLVVFFGGALVGGAVTIGVIVHRLRQVVDHPETMPARMTARLTRRLSLDADQSAQVEKLLTDRIDHVQSIRRQISPQLHAEFSGLHDDVSKLLTPKQREKWDEIYDDLNEHWAPLIAPR